MERKNVQFAIEKATMSEDRTIGTIIGYASTYGNIDMVGDRVMPGAFKKSIAKFKKTGRMIPMLSGHSTDNVIGGFDPSRMKETDQGLRVEGKVDLNTQRGREDFSLMSNGFISGMSIGGFTTPEDVTMADDGIREINNFQLYEISVTPMPANEEAQIEMVKAVPSFKDYALAPEDTEWDGSKARGQIKEKTGSADGPSSTYRNGFMYFDSSNADDFGAYKLPYVYVMDGQFKAVPRALAAIVGVLKGGRGGVDIPDADKEKVKSQVRRYYKKMGKDDPFSEKNVQIIENKSNIFDVKMVLSKLDNLIWQLN